MRCKSYTRINTCFARLTTIPCLWRPLPLVCIHLYALYVLHLYLLPFHASYACYRYTNRDDRNGGGETRQIEVNDHTCAPRSAQSWTTRATGGTS